MFSATRIDDSSRDIQRMREFVLSLANKDAPRRRRRVDEEEEKEIWCGSTFVRTEGKQTGQWCARGEREAKHRYVHDQTEQSNV
jgi:hypothetical protein